MVSGLVRLAGEDREGQSPGVTVILRAEVISETRDGRRDMGEHGYSIRTPDPSPRRLPWVNLPAPSLSSICQIPTKTKTTPSLHP